MKLNINESIGTYEIKGDFVDTEGIDTKSLKKHSSPSNEYLDSWKETINTSQKKKLVRKLI